MNILLKVGAALALIGAAPAPVTVAPVAALPIDAVARAKFPGVSPEIIDALAMVNMIVNARMTYVSDEEHYGREEMWVTAPPDMKGDCEDYALTKMEMLRQAGFPALSNARIRGVYVRDGGDAGGHAILELLMADHSIVFLDNRFDEPMTRVELVARGYTFFDW